MIISNVMHSTGGMLPSRVSGVMMLGNTRTMILCNPHTSGNMVRVAAGHNGINSVRVSIGIGDNVCMPGSCPGCLNSTRCVALCGRTLMGSNDTPACSTRSVCGCNDNLGPCHCPGLSVCSNRCLHGVCGHARTVTRVRNNDSHMRCCAAANCCHSNSTLGCTGGTSGCVDHFFIHNGISIRFGRFVGTRTSTGMAFCSSCATGNG